MSQHTLIRAGAGVGLLAASLGAAAQDLSSFGRPMAFMRIEAGKTTYAAFMPWYDVTGNGGPVIFLDLGQSGTQSTWAFGVGNADTAPANRSIWAGSEGLWPIVGSNMTWWERMSNTSTSASQSLSFSFFGGDPGSKKLADINYSTVVSSVSCDVTMDASIAADGYLKWSGIVVQPSKWTTWQSSITDNSTYALMVTSGVTSGTSSVSFTTFNSAGLASITGDKSFPTFSHTRIYKSNADLGTITAFTVFSTMSTATASYHTINSSIVKQWNNCLTVWRGRDAQNQTSAALGGKQGFMRIW